MNHKNQNQYAIICVDDDPYILQMLSFQLRKQLDTDVVLLDFFVRPEDVLPHIEFLKNKGVVIRFLIADYRMPGMSGYQLIKEVKERYPEIDCIMLSGQADDYLVNELKQKNLLKAFLGKPWKEQELVGLIDYKS